MAAPLPEGTDTTKPHLGRTASLTQGGQPGPRVPRLPSQSTLSGQKQPHTHHAREHLLGCEDVQRVFHTGVSSQNLEQPTALSRSTR